FQELAQERGKTQLLAERLQFSNIQRLQLQPRQGGFHRNVSANRGQLAAEQRLVAEVAQGIAIALLFDLRVILERLLQRAKLLDQLRGSLGTNVASLLLAFPQRRLMARQRA